MTKDRFQRRVLERIRESLLKGSVPLARARAFAAAALDLGQAHPDEIPAEALAGVLAEYPEFTPFGD